MVRKQQSKERKECKKSYISRCGDRIGKFKVWERPKAPHQ